MPVIDAEFENERWEEEGLIAAPFSVLMVCSLDSRAVFSASHCFFCCGQGRRHTRRAQVEGLVLVRAGCLQDAAEGRWLWLRSLAARSAH